MTPPPLTDEAIAELERLEKEATGAPWHLCHHLQSAEKDASCPCGKRGDIWGCDQEGVVCEMGVAPTAHPDLDPPRYKRPIELANAAIIVALRNAAPALIRAAREANELRALVKRLRAWVDRDEVRLTTMAANGPVWEELAEIDREASRLGCTEGE